MSHQWSIPRDVRKPIAPSWNSSTATTTPRQLSPAEMRIQRDLDELDLPPKTLKLVQPDSQDWLNLFAVISPDEGFYRGGHFQFSFTFKPSSYPFEPPRVKCLQKVKDPSIYVGFNTINMVAHLCARRFITQISILKAMSVWTFWERIGNLSSISMPSFMGSYRSSSNPTLRIRLTKVCGLCWWSFLRMLGRLVEWFNDFD